jgi:hypothetical protein
MVQPAKDRMRNNVSGPHDWARVGRVLPERNVSSHVIIIGGIFRKNSSKVLCVEHNQMISALASDRPDQAFNISIHWRGMHLQDAADNGAIGEHVVVVIVPLAGRTGSRRALEDQSHGRIVTRAKVYYLTVVVFLGKVLEALRDPFRATAFLHLELCTKSMT